MMKGECDPHGQKESPLGVPFPQNPELENGLKDMKGHILFKGSLLLQKTSSQ